MGTDEREHAWWDGAWSAGSLAVVCAPLLTLPLIGFENVGVSGLATASGIVAYVVVLFADLLFYLHWRMSDGPSGWLVLVLSALAVQSLALVSLLADDPEWTNADLGWIQVVQVFVALGVLVAVHLAQHKTLRVDPLVTGVVVGLVIVGFRRTLLSLGDPAQLDGTTSALLSLTLLTIDLVIAGVILRLTITASWVRVRLAASLVLLSIAHAGTYSTADDVLLSIVITAMNVLGAALLLSLAIALARNSWSDNRDAIDLLARRLHDVESGLRADQARLHEIRATVAGLGTATRLVNRSSVSDLRRQQLEDMIAAEMGRLQRLLHETPQPRRAVDLDATISPIVLRHRVRGYPIEWEPSGERAIARADDVAEVVNVLLENAYQHAPHGSASIVTRKGPGVVEISISDTGPGIDRSVRSRIFEWGERGQGSRGSGIGLNIAHQLTHSLGGYLRLVDSPLPGATFVLGLPAEELS